jgi:hypothetical protein
MWFEWRSALAAYVWLQYGATLLLSALAAQKFGAVEFPNFMFHWAAARACGSAFASAVLWAREVRGPKRAAEPLVVTRASFLGCVPPFLTNVGYVAFTALASAGGDVSILSGLATLHGLFPAVIGLFCFKEQRTTLRLAGLAAAAAAIVLMGVSTDTVPSEASWPWYARGGLFVVAICAWGLNDTASARIARHTSLRQVMLQSAVAYLVLATCWAQAAFASGSVGGRFGGMQAMLWAANFSLIFGACQVLCLACGCEWVSKCVGVRSGACVRVALVLRVCLCGCVRVCSCGCVCVFMRLCFLCVFVVGGAYLCVMWVPNKCIMCVA